VNKGQGRAGATTPQPCRKTSVTVLSALAHSLLEPLPYRLGPLAQSTCRYQRLYVNL
jgi:hypothetical protein